MHPDAGRGLERLDHLAFDGQIDLGGEVVALLLHSGVSPVSGDERLGGLVEDHRGLATRASRSTIGSPRRALPAA